MRNSLYEQQVQLEERMAKLGVDKFRDSYEHWTKVDRATETRPFRTAMNAAIAPLVEAIDAFRKQAASGKAGRRHSAVKLLAKLESPALAYITVKTVLDRMIRKRELTSMAVKLGSYMEAEASFADLDNQPSEVQGVIKTIMTARNNRHDHIERFLARMRGRIRRDYDGVWQKWTLPEKTTVGLKLIELLCQSTGLFEVKPLRKAKNKTVYMLEPTERFAEWMESLKDFHEVLFPEYLPCIIPPKDWDDLQGGGYHTQAFAYPINFVKTRSKQHRKMLRQADLSQVYKAVNAVQRTPWAVNHQLLDIAFYLMDLGTGLAGLPHRVLEEPAKPYDIDTNAEARKEWGNEFARILRININTKMQRLQAWKTIKMAQEFRKYDKIYFPYSLDFRGRIYSLVSYLSPQGTDLAKGLLHFGEGDAITNRQARDWLAIHGANCFGLDKVSFAERLKWVEANQQRIIETAQEPLDDLWWCEVDSPFCFLAFCFEWQALLEHEERGEVFHSRLAIAMDGSCNGLQHYSAMLRDAQAGKAVNLVPSDSPQDIYGAVASRVQDKLREAAASQDEDNPDYQGWAKAWLEFGIDRKITKRPVMVLPYGGRFTSCLTYVREAVEERGHLPFEDRVETNKAIGVHQSRSGSLKLFGKRPPAVT